MKVGIIGVGNVGGQLANILYRDQRVSEVVVLNINYDVAKGRVMDIEHASNSDTKIYATAEYKNIYDSDVIVICAGRRRDPGMTRDDLFVCNKGIMRSIASNLKGMKGVLIMVTNPLDLMTYIMFKELGIPKSRILGMAGVLDTNRFKYLLSRDFKCSIKDVDTLVIGEHGASMIPLLQYTKIRNMFLSTYKDINTSCLVSEVVDMGAQVTKLQGVSAYFSTASSIVDMIYQILLVKTAGGVSDIFSASVICRGEYNVSDVAIGMPIRYTPEGVEIVDSLSLEKEQLDKLKQTENKLKNILEKI